MRVIFISHVSNLYGAGRSLLGFIDGLLRKGVQCYVIMPRDGPLVQCLKERRVEYKIIPFKDWVSTESSLWRPIARMFFNLLSTTAIAVQARAWHADVIYTNSIVTPVGAFAALLVRRPHIWHIREFAEEHFGFFFDFGAKLSLKLIQRLSFRVITTSDALKSKCVQDITALKVQRVYNPVELCNGPQNDTDETQRAYKGRIPVLTIVGRVYPMKGQKDAVLAVAELVKQDIHVRLRLVGDGDAKYLEELKRILTQNDLDANVEFMGYIDDPFPIMRSADIILVCSQWEAFGRATVEGMLAGKPVVGARSGATPELIKDGFNGLLYEPGNYQDLAEKIRYLIDHPKEAKQMGVNGFEWASKEFTVEKCASQVFDVLQEAVQRKGW